MTVLYSDDTSPPGGLRIQPAYLRAADVVRLAELAEALDRLQRGRPRVPGDVPLASMGVVAGYLLREALRGELGPLAEQIWAEVSR